MTTFRQRVNGDRDANPRGKPDVRTPLANQFCAAAWKDTPWQGRVAKAGLSSLVRVVSPAPSTSVSLKPGAGTQARPAQETASAEPPIRAALS